MLVQARSGFYKAYAERLASWGYVIVQYNLPLFWVIPDANEVCFDAFQTRTTAFLKASHILCLICRDCAQWQLDLAPLLLPKHHAWDLHSVLTVKLSWCRRGILMA